jgi:guanyl-specific ribonuclease Sa
MKKRISLIILIIAISSIGFFQTNAVSAKTATTTAVKKTTTTKVAAKKKTTTTKATKATSKKKTVNKTVTTMKWSADAQKLIGNIASFDYNYSIRNAVIKKIENYAKRHKIKVITAKMINSMNE